MNEQRTISLHSTRRDTPLSPRVHMSNISQSFAGVRVLHDVNLTVAPGEVHALVGQNGAGKSTLMKILGGLYPDHRGEVLLDGEPATLSSPRRALKLGIAMIHQELSIVPTMSVAENILIGIEPGRAGYSPSRTRAAARTVVDRVPMLAALPLDVPAGDLTTGLQQRIEIAKAIARDARVLVMDEPTARLSGPERDDLRNLIKELSGEGISIVYISHFLEEIFQSCSRLTILRNGRVVGQGETSEFTMQSLTRAMLGTDLADEERAAKHRPPAPQGEVILEMVNANGPRISDITLALRAGRVLGLSGLVGSGRTQIARTLIGAERLRSGTMSFDGKPVAFHSPRDALKLGIVLLPEDRKSQGLIGIATARHNMLLSGLDRGLSRLGFIRSWFARATTTKKFSELEIRPSSPGLAAGRFSGGNQQKILLARALLARPRVLIVDQPTAGVDVGTKAQIHNLLRTVAASGTAVMVISDDLDEMLSLADDVVVVKAGTVMSRHERKSLNHTALVEAITGDEAVAHPSSSDE